MAATSPAEDATGETGAQPGEELEFRARHALTIDAQAHSLLDPRHAREMQAVPLGIEAGRPVIAVADPNPTRLSVLRELVGGETKFVLVAVESLEALLKSRIFNEGERAARTQGGPPPAQTPAPASVRVEPVFPSAANERRAPATRPLPPVTPPPPNADLVDAANVTQLAEQLAQAAETLIALQQQVRGIAGQFDQTRQELREQKERLAAAAAKADQDRARIRSVAASLAEDVARLDQTKADLTERLSGLVQENEDDD